MAAPAIPAAAGMDPISADVAKMLTHVEASVRERTVKQITSYLASREAVVGEMDDMELQKLWKALYYCFWLTDKHVNQQEMCRVLASLGTQAFSKERNVHRYFVNFFAVMRQEWTKIDYLRLDKYYSLVRRVLAEWFAFLAKTKWRMSSLEVFSVMFRDDILLPFQSDGLRMHLSFIYLTELANAGACKCDDATVRELLSPFFCVLVQPPSELMFQHAIKDVFQALDGEFAGEQRFAQLDRAKFGRAVFDIAQDVDSLKPSHRKQLYVLANKTFGYTESKKRPAAGEEEETPAKKTKQQSEEVNQGSDNEEEEEAPLVGAAAGRKQVKGKMVNLPKKTITAEEMEVDTRPAEEDEAEVAAPAKKGGKKAAAASPASAAKKKKAAAAASPAPVAAAVAVAAPVEEPAAEAAPKKKVSFSHFETQGIKQITKRMQDTPKKPAAEFAKPAKSLLRASKWPSTSSSSSTKKLSKA